MKKEKFVYGVDIGKYDNWNELSDEEVIRIGEESGVVYSIEGLIDELNSDQLNTEQYFFKII
jgi:hypothetical protein